MEYRKLPHGEEMISVIGMGSSVVGEQSEKKIIETVQYALDAAKSPFHQALTPAQCLQYALDKPGVLTVVGGPGNVEKLKEILSFLDTTEEERDYSIIGSFTPDDSVGKCVYCKHCHPCPAGLNIGLINKYYDLSLQGDVMAKDHYLTLEKHASDCIKCGHCNKRCPFSVQQQERMEEICGYFGM